MAGLGALQEIGQQALAGNTATQAPATAPATTTSTSTSSGGAAAPVLYNGVGVIFPPSGSGDSNIIVLVSPSGQPTVVGASEAASLRQQGWGTPTLAQVNQVAGSMAAANPSYWGVSSAGTGGSGEEAVVDDDAEIEQRNAQAILQQAILDLGLPPSEVDWAWTMLQQDLTPAEIMLELRKRPAYLARFIANTYRREAGLNEWSEREIIDYENGLRQELRQWGIPVQLYDTVEEIGRFIGKDLSLPEVDRRIEKGYNLVTANPEARQVFRQWYGADGDTALAMLFFDTERSLPLLERMAGAGSLGGTGVRYGITLSQQKAERLIANGVQLGSAPDAFARLGRLDPLFRETATESEDFAAEDIGVDYVFGQTRDAEARLVGRLDERLASTAGGGGAVLSGERSGLGTAQ